MTQENKIMSMESRIDRVEAEQASVREHMNRLIDSQEKQTSELSKQNDRLAENTQAIMLLCQKHENSSEIGKKALDKVDVLSIEVNTLKTKDSERARNEKVHFIGMLVIAFAAVAGALKAFGVA